MTHEAARSEPNEERADELSRLRVDLKAAIERSEALTRRIEAVLAKPELVGLEETSDGTFHSRARPRVPERPAS